MRFLVAIFALFISASAASQNATKVGDWLVDKSVSGIQIATAASDSGSTVGFLCFTETETCISYIIFAGIACKVDGTYPMMINSAIGAFVLKSTCKQVQGTSLNNIQVITEFSNVKSALENGGDVGFVLPLESGQFKVARFSAKGATAAIQSAMQLPQQRPIQEKPKGRTDQTL